MPANDKLMNTAVVTSLSIVLGSSVGGYVIQLMNIITSLFLKSLDKNSQLPNNVLDFAFSTRTT